MSSTTQLPKELPPHIAPLTLFSIRGRITDVAVLTEEIFGSSRPVNPPQWLPGMVKDWKDWPGVRPLAAVSTSPVLRGDGTIHQQPGYDEKTAILYCPETAFPPIPEHPSRDDAIAGLAKLKEGVSEFPWQEPSDRSAWLAEVLSMCCRSAVDGPVPGFTHTANIASSGKTSLFHAAHLIATGRGGSGRSLSGCRPQERQGRRRRRTSETRDWLRHPRAPGVSAGQCAFGFWFRFFGDGCHSHIQH